MSFASSHNVNTSSVEGTRDSTEEQASFLDPVSLLLLVPGWPQDIKRCSPPASFSGTPEDSFPVRVHPEVGFPVSVTISPNGGFLASLPGTQRVIFYMPALAYDTSSNFSAIQQATAIPTSTKGAMIWTRALEWGWGEASSLLVPSLGYSALVSDVVAPHISYSSIFKKQFSLPYNN